MCVQEYNSEARLNLYLFFCELHSHMFGEQNEFQQIVILITLNISLN